MHESSHGVGGFTLFLAVAHGAEQRLALLFIACIVSSLFPGPAVRFFELGPPHLAFHVPRFHLPITHGPQLIGKEEKERESIPVTLITVSLSNGSIS